jgi:formyl-CoA transferase
MIVPYGAYACADGAVMLAVQSDREWVRFCETVLEAPSLARDPRYASNQLRLANRDSLEAVIERRFASHTRVQVMAWLEAADIPTGAVNDLAALAAHPQLTARHRWTSTRTPGGQVPALVPPHNIVGTVPCMGDVPALGQHQSEVLAELEAEARPRRRRSRARRH